MSQSGSGDSNGTQGKSSGHSVETSQQFDVPSQTCQNERGEVGSKSEDAKPDLSNGFENRTMDYQRFSTETNQPSFQQPATRPQQQQQQQPFSQCSEVLQTDYPNSQTGHYPTSIRRQSMIGQPEDRHPLTGQVPAPQYPPDNTTIDRAPYVSQTGTQTLPVQLQPHFAQDYMSDQSQYPQNRSQYEVRSHLYSQQGGQYSDRAGYVTRDVTYRDSSLYAHAQSASNPVFTGGSGGYVTVQHSSQIPSQSASPQPPSFYTGLVIPSQPTAASPAYAQFTAPPQYTYSQFPQTVMNAIPHNSLAVYPAQQFAQPAPHNAQRFSQDMSQYQGQPIIQPIAQNVAASAERLGGTRGPKPMVPPRGNSKITHDQGHRKSASVDVPGPKPGAPTNQSNITIQDGNPSGTVAPVSGSDNRNFLAPLNQTPRTRQDGLYVDSNGDPTTRDKVVGTAATECGLYVSRPDHRKSISVDVTTAFQRRNDTITFTFPGENPDVTMTARKSAVLGEKKWPENNQVFANEQRRVEPVLRVSPMAFDGRQDNRKSVVVQERKPEWGNISPNQRTVVQQENRRSDYFEEHRRSPMPLDAKRMEDIRRSPMPFMTVRDPSAERAAQKSPSFPNQNFEKTRQELAMWAEHRQRQDFERTMHQTPVFSTSPRSRNQSEDRRDTRANLPPEDHRGKDPRLPQAAFQPIANITQSSIMEQRRHLRHVSADLTKQMELTRKDFDEQPMTGSVANLVPVMSTVTSQRASPNICHQFPAMSEAKLNTKMLLTVVTDFGDNPAKPGEQSDHIIHSHKKSHNISASLLTHSKSQAENLQAAQSDQQCDNNKSDTHQTQQQQQQHIQNQQSLDILSEKLSQFERQQSDLQARLQCLQNQNQILDQVAQFQHQQSDLQTRLQCLQERQDTEKTLRQATQYQQKNVLNSLQEHLLEPVGDKLNDHQNRPASNAFLSPIDFQGLLCQSLTSDSLSPRIQYETTETERISQIPLPSNSQFERSDGPRGSLQYRLACQAAAAVAAATDMPENTVVLSSGNTTTVTTSGNTCSTTVSGVTFAGTLKKVPPEKPPRTSLIVQSPEAESNRSQPAIGMKQTPKARSFRIDDSRDSKDLDQRIGLPFIKNQHKKWCLNNCHHPRPSLFEFVQKKCKILCEKVIFPSTKKPMMPTRRPPTTTQKTSTTSASMESPSSTSMTEKNSVTDSLTTVSTTTSNPTTTEITDSPTTVSKTTSNPITTIITNPPTTESTTTTTTISSSTTTKTTDLPMTVSTTTSSNPTTTKITDPTTTVSTTTTLNPTTTKITDPPTTVSTTTTTSNPTTTKITDPTTTVSTTTTTPNPTTTKITDSPTTVSTTTTSNPTTTKITDPTTTVSETISNPTTVKITDPPTTVSTTSNPITASKTVPPTTLPMTTSEVTTVKNTNPPTTVSIPTPSTFPAEET